MKDRIIRALYDETTITIYQAYNETIANSALKAQTFISPPFKKDRMTWIKPSFLWMMYRSGWATKKDQEVILSIKIKRTGFEWALNNSCLTRYNEEIYGNYENWQLALTRSPVRVQWDPEKTISFENLPYKSIQIGLSGLAINEYLSDWIVEIVDITKECSLIHDMIINKKESQITSLLPNEKIYPLPNFLSKRINSDLY